MGQPIAQLVVVVQQIGISALPSAQDVAITGLLAHLKAINVIAVGAIVCAQNAHSLLSANVSWLRRLR